MRCPNCGQAADPGFQFCVGCGSVLEVRDGREDLPSVTASPLPPPPPWDPARPEHPGSQAFKALQVATSYRALLLWYGGAILLNVLLQFGTMALGALEDSDVGPAVALLLLAVLGVSLLVGLACYVMVAIQVFQLTTAMDSGAPWAWTLGMLVPCCLNLILLLILSSNAQQWLKSRGIPVGLFGPTAASIQELRRLARQA